MWGYPCGFVAFFLQLMMENIGKTGVGMSD
jgi:hypothetical protein